MPDRPLVFVRREAIAAGLANVASSLLFLQPSFRSPRQRVGESVRQRPIGANRATSVSSMAVWAGTATVPGISIEPSTATTVGKR